MKYCLAFITIIFFFTGTLVASDQFQQPQYKCEVGGPMIGCGGYQVKCSEGFVTEKVCDDYVKTINNSCPITKSCYPIDNIQTDTTFNPSKREGYSFNFEGKLGVLVPGPYCSIGDCNQVRQGCVNKSDCKAVSACAVVSDVTRCNVVTTPPPAEYTPPEAYEITERISNPLESTTVNSLIAKLYRAVIMIVVPLLVLALVYTGFMFVLAQGNEEKLKTAKRNALYIIIGIVIIMSADLVRILIQNLLNIFN